LGHQQPGVLSCADISWAHINDTPKTLRRRSGTRSDIIGLSVGIKQPTAEKMSQLCANSTCATAIRLDGLSVQNESGSCDQIGLQLIAYAAALISISFRIIFTIYNRTQLRAFLDVLLEASQDSPACLYDLQIEAAGLAATTTRCARSLSIPDPRKRKYESEALRQIPTRHITKILELGCEIAFE
jgi:hypothetical protein